MINVDEEALICDFAETYHLVKSKVALNIKLNRRERSFYLLFVANEKEVKEFLKNEKK